MQPSGADQRETSARFDHAVRIGAVLAFSAIVLALFFGVLMLVQTKEGVVRIELSDPDADVLVKVDGETVRISDQNREVTLRAGDHQLLVQGDGFETVSQAFKVVRGDKAVLKVTLIPEQPVAKTAEPAAPERPAPPPPPDPVPVPKPKPAAESLAVAVGQAIELSGPTLDGGQIDLADFRGKVVLIDFWASWCPPCRREMPNVLATYKQHHQDGFEIIGVNLDRTKEDLLEYLKEEPLPWKQVFFEDSRSNPLALKFNVRSIPYTLLIDRYGKVAHLNSRGLALGNHLAAMFGKAPSAAPDVPSTPLASSKPTPTGSPGPGITPLGGLTPLAHFRFNGNAEDETAGNPAFELNNTEFRDGALYVNGIYEHGSQAGGYRAICRTPQLEYSAFSAAIRFKAEEFDGRQSNLLTGGHSYRWFGMRRSPDGNLTITLNNQRFSHVIPGTPIEAGKWTTVACGVDLPGRKILVFVDGQQRAEIELPDDLKFEVADSKAKESDKHWVFTNYSNATVFHGLVDELLIYGRMLSAEELQKLTGPAPQTTSKPAVPAAAKAEPNPGADYPPPRLRFVDIDNQSRCNLTVENWQDYPDELFASSPDLPPIGLNKSASRTTVSIRGADGQHLYGFVAFGAAANLNKLWFGLRDKPIKEVYIVLIDRRTKKTYQSNTVAIPQP